MNKVTIPTITKKIKYAPFSLHDNGLRILVKGVITI